MTASGLQFSFFVSCFLYVTDVRWLRLMTAVVVVSLSTTTVASLHRGKFVAERGTRITLVLEMCMRIVTVAIPRERE